MREKHYTIRKDGQWHRIYDPQGVPLINTGYPHELVRWLEMKASIEAACTPPSRVTWTVEEECAA